MAVLEIVKAGDPVLKQIAVPIAKVDSKLRKLMDRTPKAAAAAMPWWH